MRKYITSIIASLIALSCFHGQVLANYIDIKDQYGKTSLHIAAQAGDTNAVQALSQAGADINTRDEFGTTPLIEASRCGHDQIVRMLIQAGADVNACNQLGDTPITAALDFPPKRVPV